MTVWAYHLLRHPTKAGAQPTDVMGSRLRGNDEMMYSLMTIKNLSVTRGVLSI